VAISASTVVNTSLKFARYSVQCTHWLLCSNNCCDRPSPCKQLYQKQPICSSKSLNVFRQAFNISDQCFIDASGRSLENTSSSIRWSLDLRWQHPDQPDGAYGLKRAIRMTAPGDPGYVIPWEGWADVDKKTGAAAGKQQQGSKVNNANSDGTNSSVTAAAVVGEGCDAGAAGSSVVAEPAAGGADDAESPLSTVLVGPWLDLWPITHENKHTRAWQAMQIAGK
jgi:hypothetical protein